YTAARATSNETMKIAPAIDELIRSAPETTGPPPGTPSTRRLGPDRRGSRRSQPFHRPYGERQGGEQHHRQQHEQHVRHRATPPLAHPPAGSPSGLDSPTPRADGTARHVEPGRATRRCPARARRRRQGPAAATRPRYRASSARPAG